MFAHAIYVVFIYGETLSPNIIKTWFTSGIRVSVLRVNSLLSGTRAGGLPAGCRGWRAARWGSCRPDCWTPPTTFFHLSWYRPGPRVLTEDGNEVVVQTNYLAHFLLTHLLKVRQGCMYIFISFDYWTFSKKFSPIFKVYSVYTNEQVFWDIQ